MSQVLCHSQAWDLMLFGCCLNNLNKFTFEFVFDKWCLMGEAGCASSLEHGFTHGLSLGPPCFSWASCREPAPQSPPSDCCHPAPQGVVGRVGVGYMLRSLVKVGPKAPVRGCTSPWVVLCWGSVTLRANFKIPRLVKTHRKRKEEAFFFHFEQEALHFYSALSRTNYVADLTSIHTSFASCSFYAHPSSMTSETNPEKLWLSLKFVISQRAKGAQNI